jgi:DNA-binding MarR family transcriptional regulator/predicted GNAT family acetyltransferase
MPAAFDRHVQDVRSSNRSTRRIGVLEEGLLHSPFSLTEARVLFELAHREQPEAAELARDLGLDPGYLSRLLRGFRRRRLVASRPVAGDRRRRRLELTSQGRTAFAELDLRCADRRDAAPTPPRPGRPPRRDAPSSDCAGATPPRACGCAACRRSGLGGAAPRRAYAEEYGWDERFEGLVAGVVAEFAQRFDARRERCWIAEREGEKVGSVFLVRHTDEVAKLRLLLVEPGARGLGLGSRLVTECIQFARDVGYRRITLWTNDVLHAARHIYQTAGFRLVKREPHRQFGTGLVGETWELDL